LATSSLIYSALTSKSSLILTTLIQPSSTSLVHLTRLTSGIHPSSSSLVHPALTSTSLDKPTLTGLTRIHSTLVHTLTSSALSGLTLVHSTLVHSLVSSSLVHSALISSAALIAELIVST